MSRIGKNSPLEQAESMPRNHHYLFAHRALYACAQTEPHKTAWILLGSDAAAEFLESLWVHVGEQLPYEDRLSSEGLASTAAPLDEKTAVAVVRMPEPRGITEAYFVAIVFTHHEGDGSEQEPPDMRYITLERGMTLDGQERTVLCEWQEESHLNYGEGPRATESDFLETVRGMINR